MGLATNTTLMKNKTFEHKDLKINFTFYLSGNNFMFSNEIVQCERQKPAIKFTQLSLAYEILNMYKKQKVNSSVFLKDLIS